ncbi:hypothetical protein ACFOHK_15615 [Falsigemmobacter intermedius]|uniref:Uncharacterized protein n=1 Tax=Falsigemmobacter intermedius TaxID=1553448 RepID=A0A3S3UQL8_9RHOB|nr:hypothetical protein [Falsigemmobacter intermedius]RWY38795.1 hypothetical protein EP867_15450 [Falsigemmobacter intermedius]
MEGIDHIGESNAASDVLQFALRDFASVELAATVQKATAWRSCLFWCLSNVSAKMTGEGQSQFIHCHKVIPAVFEFQQALCEGKFIRCHIAPE